MSCIIDLLLFFLICTCLVFYDSSFSKTSIYLDQGCVFRNARWYIGLGRVQCAVLPEQFKYLKLAYFSSLF